METVLAALPIMLVICLAALVIVLFMGLFSMGRGGMRGSRLSNKMMRLRVGIQAVAVIILGIMLFFSGR